MAGPEYDRNETLRASHARNRSRSETADKLADAWPRSDLDALIDRIEKRVIERNMGEPIATARADEADYGYERTVNGAETTLGSIERRIESIGHAVEEIGHKLNAHADMVHGPCPTEHDRGNGKLGRDKPNSAIQRIFMALDTLDNATSYMAEAAGRNCTLA